MDPRPFVLIAGGEAFELSGAYCLEISAGG